MLFFLPSLTPSFQSVIKKEKDVRISLRQNTHTAAAATAAAGAGKHRVWLASVCLSVFSLCLSVCLRVLLVLVQRLQELLELTLLGVLAFPDASSESSLGPLNAGGQR